MIKKLSDFLSGIKMTVISGIFLAISLVLMLNNNKLPIDPAWITIIISGLPLLYLAITRLIFEKWISSALLISIAMIASIAIGELFAAGEVAFIMAIGAILEDMTVARAKKGLSNLISLIPQKGRKLIFIGESFYEEFVPIEEVRKDDILRVLPGEVVPVDGVIIAGDTSVEQAVITGESLPIDKTINDAVFCGTMNCFGSIEIKATQVGKDSSLQKMIDMVKEAENKKAPMQRLVDKWATWLVPIALFISIATYLITLDVVRAVTILVVFCPCALALATPTSIMAAIGQATKHGVLIKSGEALEKMGKVDYITFDKTGTLTVGNLKVSDTITVSPYYTGKDILKIAASVEIHSEHPLGKAIASYARSKDIHLMKAENFQMEAGKGVRAKVEGASVLCGSSAYLIENKVRIDEKVESDLRLLRSQGKASILIGKHGECIGIIALSDTLKASAKDMVNSLKRMNTEVALLTGDHSQTAKYFAEQIGIENIHAQLLPADKVAYIQQLQSEGKNICMIGDGVNDAPALKTANVGIAMGSMGSDIAIEAADIALMSDDIENIPYLKKLSNSTLKTIKGNITASMVINFVAIILSVLGVLNPITGAIVHNVGSVLVVLNAALLYDRKFN